MATVKRNDAKNQIIDILRNQGYPSYAKLVNLFDIYLTDDPEVVGYMVPGKAKIVLNGMLNTDQVSTIIRHEILHEYFVHAKRAQDVDKSHPDLYPDHKLANIAGDYDISNKGYTDADKATARSIILGDKVLKGLVTEDDYPDWTNMSFEEMYTQLLEQRKKDIDKLKPIIDKLDKLLNQDIDDLNNDIQDAQNEQQQPSSNSQQDTNGPSSSRLDKESETELDKIAKAADNAQKQSKELSSTQSDATPIDTPVEQKEKEELAKRIIQIKKAFEDLKQKEEIMNDTSSAIRKEKAEKEARNIERIQRSGISRFKLSLNHFIANQIEQEEFDSYARENPTYADSEFILPGKLVKEEKHIPIINVYWDVSASFKDPSKTQGAKNAIGTLNQYVRSGDIEIHVYYFADRVSSTPTGAGSGTSAIPVVEHIQQTKPDNVIIITDGDTSNQRIPSVTVPGAVWLLFYDSRSDALINNVRGKKENKFFDIEY